LIYIAIFIIACIIFRRQDTARIRNGKKYENRVSKFLYKKLGVEPYISVLVKKNVESLWDLTSEIDLAFANKKGVFCVECKTRKKDIEPTISLTHELWDMDGYKIKNPVNQNHGHVMDLSVAMEREIPGIKQVVFNVVSLNFHYIFNNYGNKDISKNGDTFTVIPNSNKMIACSMYRNDGLKKMVKYIKTMPDIYTDEEVEKINEFLASHVGTKKELKQHVFHVKLHEFEKEEQEKQKSQTPF